MVIDPDGRPYFALNFSTLKSRLLALSADGASIQLMRDMSGTSQILALDGNGGLYTATSAVAIIVSGYPNHFCPTTPGAYQPLSSGGGVICVAKLDLSEDAPAQFSVPLNSASLNAAPDAPMAPGEFVTINGIGLPTAPIVAFDGKPATILYSDAERILTAVPYDVGIPLTTLTIDGVGGLNLYVWPASPGLFTSDGSGFGQLDASNEDGTANSADNPAAVGTVVTVFVNGAGAMSSLVAGGDSVPLAVPVLNFFATMGGTPTTVVGANQAPGRMAGIVSVGIRVPVGTPAGAAVVGLSVGNGFYENFPAQPRTTIAVQ